jgi:GH25 family lysozyme M1 (1,4-beta-N-acetylmuramidase)
MGDSAARAFQRVRLFVALCLAVGSAALLVVPASAQTTTLAGIDVSHYQGSPDWSQVQADGVTFVFHKVTEGTTILDGQYATNRQQIEALGLAFGAYHYAHPGKAAGDAVAEADWFVSNAQLTGANLLPVLDLEDSGGLGVKKLKQWTKAWLAEAQAKLGVKAIIYTGPSFWKTAMGNTTWFADNGYPLWIAHYTPNAQPTVPASNWGGHGWTFWQYTNLGTVAGIDGNVDQDRYNGTVLAPLKIKNNR